MLFSNNTFISARTVTKVTREMRALQDADLVKIDVHVDSDRVEGPRRKSTSSGGNPRAQGKSTGEDPSDPCTELGTARTLRHRHQSDAVVVDGSLVGDRAQDLEDQAHRVDFPVGAKDDQFGKNKIQKSGRRIRFRI